MGLRELHHKYVFERRVRVLSTALASELPPNAAVLDVGCGDGTISRQIADRRPDVQVSGVDVLVRPDTAIPVLEFDGTRLPYEDSEFDVVQFVDVLHHTEDPTILLAEAARVSRHRVLIKDHLRDRPLAGPTLRLMDWVGNAPHGVVLPYNYWRRDQWAAAFETTHLQVERWRDDLHLYPQPAELAFGGSLHFIATLAVSTPR